MNTDELRAEILKQMPERGLRFNVTDPRELEDVIAETADYIYDAYEQYANAAEAVKVYLDDTMENYPEHIEPIRERIEPITVAPAQETGLKVFGRTQSDNNEIQDAIEETDFKGEFNVREGFWFFASDLGDYDELENELANLFDKFGINARFEGVFYQ